MKKQRYTSADTSINSTKKPAIYRLAADLISTGTVIDYGCGKHFDCYDLPERFTGYDPFNRPDESALSRHYDTAIVSNVLNVIAEDDVRRELLETVKSLADTVIITVYEGDKTGTGCITKRDCYQLNRRRREYIPELVAVFGPDNVRSKRGCFICRS